MRRCVPVLTGFTMFLAAAFVTSAQSAPETLRPPANEQLLSQVHAKGEQIYSCKADGAQFAWTLKGVEAQLTDKDGKPFGKHYTGPMWEAKDGSKVVGEVVARDNGPDPAAIPWLLLHATSATGTGIFAQTQSIQRLRTVGGKAPAEGCTEAQNGSQLRVPYAADYLFYR